MQLCFGWVHAATPAPSSFFGTVELNNENLPEGTSLPALIDGQVVATVHTTISQG
jgi:hypothetical protein